MTGFGIGEQPFRGTSGMGRLTVELRGVNHRFLDVRVRVPREVGDLASLLEQLARERLSRGRYEVSVRVDGIPLGATVLDRERARTAYRALTELRDELAPNQEVPLSLLASIPDLFVSSIENEFETLKDATRKSFALAVQSLDAMRSREGVALKADLAARLDNARALAKVVGHRAPDVMEHHRRKLRERADRLRGATDVEIEPGRLEQEVALFAERIDIAEELTRLEAHAAQFLELAELEEPCGRRLDFLLQEMAREANTIGAKSPDAAITHSIVELKAELERMREQVQNVE